MILFFALMVPHTTFVLALYNSAGLVCTWHQETRCTMTMLSLNNICIIVFHNSNSVFLHQYYAKDCLLWYIHMQQEYVKKVWHGNFQSGILPRNYVGFMNYTFQVLIYKPFNKGKFIHYFIFIAWMNMQVKDNYVCGFK